MVAILIAAPAVLVPIIVVLAIYWARQSFYQQSPAAPLAGSQTISRAISDPGIADIFAPTISLAAVLLTAVVWRIILLLHAAIEAAFRHDPRAARIATGVLALAAIAEAVGIFGMVLLSWLAERDLHIGGSYLFFFGQATAILGSGVVCRMLLRTAERDDAPPWTKSGLSRRLSRLRSRTAPGIAAAALVFWIVYLVRDGLDHTPDWLERAFSALEIALIVSFLLYLATFSVELFRAQLGWGRGSADR
jgi:F0F1-type ATP synthase membrane subunit c/vacuolar-type H+-ATPase subunit K